MTSQSNRERVRNLYQMLFEMATGNLTVRICENHNDQLGELAAMLNSIASVMHEVIKDSFEINLLYTYQNLIETTFVLDENFKIVNVSANITVLLGYRPEEIFKLELADILLQQSRQYWENIILEAKQDGYYHNTVRLLFITATKQVVPSFCTVSRLLYSDKIFVSSVTTKLQDMVSTTDIIKSESPSSSDVQTIQELYDYILLHLDEPLPNLRELSQMFGTNQFKLKENFRKYFNTSIYQFYTDERLKKAHIEIRQTNIPLKVIAFNCGYQDYINFFKAFKKKFGYAPSQLQRNSQQPI